MFSKTLVCRPLVLLILCLSLPQSLDAQLEDDGPNSSLLHSPVVGNGQDYEELPAPLTILNGSPLRSVPIPPRQIKLHDIISIRIDELARMQTEGEVQRRKNASLNAAILDWVTLNGFTAAIPDPQRNGNQRIQGQLNELYRAENEIETTERLTFNIAAEVVDIRPNGNIVLEARKEVRNNDEVWCASLTGICRQQDIGLDNVVLSRNIVDLRIDRRQIGHVNDATQRGWLMKLYDMLHPF